MSNGSIELIDKMGTDLTVVNAARVSMNKKSGTALSGLHFATIEECVEAQAADPMAVPLGGVVNDDGLYRYTVFREEDAKLIDYLAKNGHWSPFSHVMLQFRVAQPMFVARQWYKHRMGVEKDAGWNEVSRRYVKDEPQFYRPPAWRAAAEKVKQGSHPTQTVETIFNGKPINGLYEAHLEASRRLYEGMIAEGVAPEQARIVLPMSMMTEWIETGSLFAYARIATLRLDAHAQAETRGYAQAIDQILSFHFPLSWRALMTYGVPNAS